MSSTFSSRRILFVAEALLVALHAVLIPALAQPTHQTRPSRLLAGLASGGSADNVARVVAAEMSKNLGRQVVVENKTGVSANIATQTLRAVPADGCANLFAGLTLVTHRAVIESLGYNPSRGLALVSQITAPPLVSQTRGDSPLNSLQDVIAMATARNGTLRFDSGGDGRTSNLAPELIAGAAAFKRTHVPYRGGAHALQALFPGEIDLMFDLMEPTQESNAEAGKSRFLGVMHKGETPLWPWVKPAGAQGVFEAALMRSWQGVAVKNARTPEIVAKPRQSAMTVLRSEEVGEKLSAIWPEVKVGASLAEFQKLYEDKLGRWATLNRVDKAAGIKDEH